MKKILADRPLARLAFMIARAILLVYAGIILYMVFFLRRVLYYPMRARAAALLGQYPQHPCQGFRRLYR